MCSLAKMCLSALSRETTHELKELGIHHGRLLPTVFPSYSFLRNDMLRRKTCKRGYHSWTPASSGSWKMPSYALTL
jgi:hypothetical protein